MAESGLELRRRLVAIRHAADAHANLTALRRTWLLANETRPAARDLAPIMDQMLEAAAILNDGDADHLTAAPLLLSAAQALDRVAGVGNVQMKPIWDALYAAWKEITEQRGK